MANREVINLILKNHLLESVFPKLLPKFNKELMKNNAYMVVIGGVSVEMCARLDKIAEEFLHNVFSEDIDIKLVSSDPSVDIDIIHDIRTKFLHAVIRKLRRFIALNQSKWDASIDVNVKLDTSLLNHPLKQVAAARVVSIGIEYSEGKYQIAYPLVDTTLFTTQATKHFHVFQRMMKSEYPVPFYTKKGVNYATCEYMLYDNCRMLVDRANYLKEKKTLFALMKFTKYVIKFMSLYVLRKKIKSLPKELLDIYNEAYEILQNINTYKLKNGFKKMNKVKYDSNYVNAVVSNLDTILKASNMKSLIRAASSTPSLGRRKAL